MTTVIIRTAARRFAEFAWVCDVIFSRWLGLAYSIEIHDEPFVEIEVGHGRVRWTDVFFDKADACWLQPESLPSLPCRRVSLVDKTLQERIGQPDVAELFGDARFERSGLDLHLPVDITGSAFFLLSRYEEAVSGVAIDRHGRFRGSASVMHREGLALRPLVDEWVELLWWALQQVAPFLERKVRVPCVWVSCDVDVPYSPGAKSLALGLRQTASDLVNHRSWRQAGRTLLNAAASRVGVVRSDPFDTFDWMLDLLEQAGHRATFFFLSVIKPERIDGCYELGEARVAALLRRIVQRGHEVGLHGSYYSVDSFDQLAHELDGLRRAIAREGGTQTVFGGRQHYLRWRMPDTARKLDALGLAYDSTLGFADIAGFRCGTCHVYPLFDFVERRPLALIERPLVLMEATVVSPTYLGLGCGPQARALMMGIRDSCRRFGGEFSLLWHNSNFGFPGARELYEELIQPFR